MSVRNIDCYPARPDQAKGLMTHDGRRTLRGIKQEKFFGILATVDEPEKIRMIRDAVFVNDPICKIKCLVKELKQIYQMVDIQFFPHLSHLHYKKVCKELDPLGLALADISLIQGLVVRVLSLGNHEMKIRAALALHLLEEIDPSLEAVNYQVSQYLKTQSSNAAIRLKNYTEMELPSLAVTYSVKPYPKHPKESVPVIVPEPYKQFWKIESVYIGLQADCHAQNLINISIKEKFKVKLSRVLANWSIGWLRDIGLLLPTGRLLIPRGVDLDKSLIKAALQIVEDYDNDTMGWVGEKKISKLLIRSKNLKLTEAPFYFEGGNLLFTLNKKNERVALSGAHNLLFSLLISHQLYAARKEELCIKIKTLEEQKFYTNSGIKKVISCFKRAGLFKNFENYYEQVLIAKLSLAIIGDLKKKMRIFLEVPVLNLGSVFDPMPFFHLDMFLAPGPNGIVYMHDDLLASQILEETLRENLTYVEIKQLLKYYDHAVARNKKYGSKFKQIREQLEPHFHVVSVSGIFFKDSSTMSANFINSVIGVNEEGKTFCISNGSCHPADRLLRKAFVRQLEKSGVENVYFTGRKSEGNISCKGTFPFQAAKSALKYGGGIHCLVQNFNHESAEVFDGDPLPFIKVEKTEKESKNAEINQLLLFFREMVNKILNK